MKKMLLLFVLLCSGYAAPSLAQACTTLHTLPATISEAGNYCLGGNQNLDMASGSALSIAASNVTFDCQDFAISNGASGGTAVAINILSKNTITVRNCRILGNFHTGIRASQNNAAANSAYYVTLHDNFIAGPLAYGIFANGSGIEIRDNRIYDIGGTNGIAAGIRLGASTLAGHPRFHLVKDNLVAGTNSAGNNAHGILSDNSQVAIIINNGISGTTATNGAYRSYGVRMMSGTYNRITDNHIVGSGLTNDSGIVSASATDSCHDNYIRSEIATTTCNATFGNF